MRTIAVVAFVLAGAVGAACGEDHPTCFAGDYRACRCSAEATGYQSCVPAEETYGPCVCDGTTPGLDAAASAPESGAVDAGGRAFLDPCTTNAECETGVCFAFPSRGMICTLRCDGPDDCPFPSPGCNNQGVCRP